MTDQFNTQQQYQQWLAQRRDEHPPVGLADQIMDRVAEFECHRQDDWQSRLVQQIECSRAARWSVCGGALAVGVLPFLFFAYVPSF